MTDQATTTTTAAPKKSAKKASAKKSPKKKAAKKAATPRAKKDGLRKPQVRVLAYLAKSTKSRTRAEIAEGAEVDHAMLNSYIGAHDDKVRAANDKKVCVSLLTLGHVKQAAPENEDNRGVAYAITASGRKALEAAKK